MRKAPIEAEKMFRRLSTPNEQAGAAHLFDRAVRNLSQNGIDLSTETVAHVCVAIAQEFPLREAVTP